MTCMHMQSQKQSSYHFIKSSGCSGKHACSGAAKSLNKHRTPAMPSCSDSGLSGRINALS